MSLLWKNGLKGSLMGLGVGAVLGIAVGAKQMRVSNDSPSVEPHLKYGVKTAYLHMLPAEGEAIRRFIDFKTSDASVFFSLVENFDRLIGLYQLAVAKKGKVSFSSKASRYCFNIEQLLNHLRSRYPGNELDFAEDVAVLTKQCNNYKHNINQEMAGQIVRVSPNV
jgi:hypothetical protein